MINKKLFWLLLSAILIAMMLAFNESTIKQFIYNLNEKTMYNIDADPKKLNGYNIEVFAKTEGWELAKAVESENTSKIKEIISEDSSLRNLQDPYHGMTILAWAVNNRKYEAAKTLAELGADPNLDSKDVISAFFIASEVENTSKYLKLLFTHGGNVNAEFKKGDTSHGYHSMTPICEAATHSFENLKLLIEAGANVNYRGAGAHALYMALNEASVRKDDEPISIVRYLIIDCKVDVKSALSFTLDNYGKTKDSIYISSILRELEYPLNSKKYKIKMEIVDYLKKNGIDYRKEPIPEDIAKNHDKDYLDKY